MQAGFVLQVATVGVVLAILGCGGVPTTPGPDVIEPASTPSLITTSTIRLLQPGDSWTYRQQGTLSMMSFGIDFASDITHTILPETVTDYTGTMARVKAITDDSRFAGDTPSLSSASNQVYFTQTADGTLYAHGEYDDVALPAVRRFVTRPSAGREILMPSPLTPGSEPVVTSVAYDDGTVEDCRIVVGEIESVNVPVGEFMAVKVQISGTRRTGAVTTNFMTTTWYVPALGAEVKTESTVMTQDYASGDTLTESSVRELTSTTVSVDD